jgi:hypothetical protein
MARTAMPVALACALLAGCGSLSPAQRYAESINLKAGDVPGFRAIEGEVEGDSPGASGNAYAKCSHSPPVTLLVVARRSPSFQNNVISLASHVEIWPTPELAARSVATHESAQGRECERRELEAKAQLGARYSGGADNLLPSAAPNVPESYRTRLITVATRLRARAGRTVYFDSVGFLSGRAEIWLSLTAFRPPPATIEQRLLSLLYSRAKAHKL